MEGREKKIMTMHIIDMMLTISFFFRKSSPRELHIDCDVEGPSLLVVVVVGHPFSNLLDLCPRPCHFISMDMNLWTETEGLDMPKYRSIDWI